MLEHRYIVYDARYHYDEDRAWVLYVADTLEEAVGVAPMYGEDCVVVRYDEVGEELQNPAVVY